MRTLDNKNLQRRVDEVLYYIWDPLGVSEEPIARSEYESYVPKILQLVEENETIQPVSDHLADIINSQMGLSAEKTHCDHVAETLLHHKEAIKRRCA